MRLCLSLALPVALAIAACGDGLEDGETLSKDEYIDRGNEICRETEEKLEESSPGEGADPESNTSYVTDTVIPAYEDQIDQLREGIPAGDEATINPILDEFQTAVDELKTDPSLLFADGHRFVPVYTELGQYGLTDCDGN